MHQKTEMTAAAKAHLTISLRFVFKFLDDVTLIYVRQVCRTWKQMIEKEFLKPNISRDIFSSMIDFDVVSVWYRLVKRPIKNHDKKLLYAYYGLAIMIDSSIFMRLFHRISRNFDKEPPYGPKRLYSAMTKCAKKTIEAHHISTRDQMEAYLERYIKNNQIVNLEVCRDQVAKVPDQDILGTIDTIYGIMLEYNKELDVFLLYSRLPAVCKEVDAWQDIYSRLHGRYPDEN